MEVAEQIKVSPQEMSVDKFMAGLSETDRKHILEVVKIINTAMNEQKISGLLYAVGSTVKNRTTDSPAPKDIDLVWAIDTGLQRENLSSLALVSQTYDTKLRIINSALKQNSDSTMILDENDEYRPFPNRNSPNIPGYDGVIRITGKDGGLPIEIINIPVYSSLFDLQKEFQNGKRPFSVLSTNLQEV